MRTMYLGGEYTYASCASENMTAQLTRGSVGACT